MFNSWRGVVYSSQEVGKFQRDTRWSSSILSNFISGAGVIVIHFQDTPRLDSRPDPPIRRRSIDLEQCVLYKQRSVSSWKEDDPTLAKHYT